jgi:hypothetical protein
MSKHARIFNGALYCHISVSEVKFQQFTCEETSTLNVGNVTDNHCILSSSLLNPLHRSYFEALHSISEFIAVKILYSCRIFGGLSSTHHLCGAAISSHIPLA